MTGVEDAGTWLKPIPEPDAVNRSYWEAAAEGRLLIQTCPSCAHRQFYPRAMCTRCAGTVEWLECSGHGTVHTFTVIRQMGMPPFSDEVPYAVAMIELEEGPLIMGNVTDCDPKDLRVGLPVDVYFLRADDEIGIPNWRPS